MYRKTHLLLWLVVFLLVGSAPTWANDPCADLGFCADDRAEAPDPEGGDPEWIRHPTWFRGTAQHMGGNVVISMGDGSSPWDDAVGGLASALSTVIEDFSMKCPTSQFQNLPTFTINPNNPGSTPFTNLELVYKADDRPSERLGAGRYRWAEFEYEYGSNTNRITVWGKCPSGNTAMECFGGKAKWDTQFGRDALLHELMHSMGLGHDHQHGSCAASGGLMREIYPAINGSFLDGYCALANFATCDPDSQGALNCEDPRPTFPIGGQVFGIPTTEFPSIANTVTYNEAIYAGKKVALGGSDQFLFEVLECADYRLEIEDIASHVSCPTLEGRVEGAPQMGLEIQCTVDTGNIGIGLDGDGLPRLGGVKIDFDLNGELVVEDQALYSPGTYPLGNAQVGDSYNLRIKNVISTMGENILSLCYFDGDSSGTIEEGFSGDLGTIRCERMLDMSETRPRPPQGGGHDPFAWTDIESLDCDLYCPLIPPPTYNENCLGTPCPGCEDDPSCVCVCNRQEPVDSPGCYFDCTTSGGLFSTPISLASVWMATDQPNTATVVDQTLTLTASAQDADGLQGFVIGIDGEYVADIPAYGATSSSFTRFEVDTSHLAEGPHTVSVITLDSTPVPTVTEFEFLVDHDPVSCSSDSIPPDLSILTPLDGARLPAGQIPFYASATDGGSGVEKVRFMIQNDPKHVDYSSPYTYSNWFAAPRDEPYALQADAWDNCGNRSTATIQVEIYDGSQQPFHGTPTVLGPSTSRLEAEDYDLGGEAAAYHDVTTANEGGAYRSDGVDIETRAGGHAVAYTRDGEWLEYTVTVPETGAYDVVMDIQGNNPQGGTFTLELDGQPITPTVTVPYLFSVWQPIVVPDVQLTAGTERILRLAIGRGTWKVDFLEFRPRSTTSQEPYLGYAVDIGPGTSRIQAENYDLGGEAIAYHDGGSSNIPGAYRQDGVDIEARGSGYAVSYISQGEWLEYTVDVVQSGTYDLYLEVQGNNSSGADLRLLLNGQDVTNTITLPYVNGVWQTVRVPSVFLSAGQQKVLRLDAQTGGFKVDWLEFRPPVAQQSPYGGSPHRIDASSRLESEHYDYGGEAIAYFDTTSTNDGGAFRSDAVDISTSGSITAVSHNRPGEWLEYTVDVDQSTNYTLRFRVLGTNPDGADLHLELDGQNVTGTVTVPEGTWTTVTVPNVHLGAGQDRILRMAVETGGFWVDWIEFQRQ